MMKLIKCHINGFGHLRDFDFRFDPSFTSVTWNNGEGKSTLCAFVKAMLFGMPTARKNGKEDFDRMHYLTSPYGGSLDFEHGGATYHLERDFDQAKEALDSVRLYINGTMKDGDFKNIGNDLFGIDEEAFFSTLLISSSSLEVESTDSIASKLNAAASGIVELSTFKKAVKYLDDQKRPLGSRSAPQKELNKKINAISSRINECQPIIDGASKLFEELKDLSESKKRLRDDFSKAYTLNNVFDDWNRFDELDKKARDEKAKLDAFKPTVGNATISKVALGELRAKSLELNSALTNIESSKFPADKENELQILNKKYEKLQDKLPLLGEMKDVCKKMDVLKARLSSLQEIAVGQEKTNVDGFAKAFESARKIRLDVIDLKQRSDSIRLHFFDRPWVLYGLMLAFAVFAAAGVGLLFIPSMLPLSIAFISVGSVSLVLAVLIFLFRANKSIRGSMWERKKKLLLEIEGKLADLNKLMSSVDSKYAFGNEAEAEAKFDLFASDFKRSEEDNEKTKANDERIKETQRQIDECKLSLDEYLLCFGMKAAAGDYSSCLENIEKDKSKLAMLTDDKSNSVRLLFLHSNNKNLIMSSISSYLAPLGISVKNEADIQSLINVLANDLDIKTSLENNAKKAYEDRDNFKKEKGLTDRPEGSKQDLRALKEQEDEITNRISKIHDELKSAIEASNVLSEAEKEKERLQQIASDNKAEYELLSKAQALLEQANSNIRSRYVAPIKTAFDKYAKQLSSLFGDDVVLNADMKLTYTKGSKVIEQRFLSTGEQAMTYFCLRLALIEQMFKDEQVFVILDDPFMSLDNDHMDKMRELIRNIPTANQMIYLTCSDSRKI